MTATMIRTVPRIALLAVILHALLLPQQSEGFQPPSVSSQRRFLVAATKKPISMSTLKVTSDAEENQDALSLINKASAMMGAWATSALIPAAAALAAASDAEGGEYVYGAVDAPVGLAVGAGILAIATAALPVLLRSGEEAFEEIRERDAGTFGATDKNKDVLKSRRK